MPVDLVLDNGTEKELKNRRKIQLYTPLTETFLSEPMGTLIPTLL